MVRAPLFVRSLGDLKESRRQPNPRLAQDVEGWLGRIGTRESPIVRAALRNQAPFMVGWFESLLFAASRVDETLSAHQPSRVVLTSLPFPFRPLFLSRAASLGVPLDATQKTERPHVLDFSRLLNEVRHELVRWCPRRARLEKSEGILVFSLQPNSTRAFLPVARELRAQGIDTRFVVAGEDRLSVALICDQGFSFEKLPTRLTDVGVVAFATNRIRKLISRQKLEEVFEIAEAPSWLPTTILSPLLVTRLLRQFSRALLTGLAIDRALDQIQPQTLVFITHRALIDSILRSRGGSEKKVFYLQGVVPEIPKLETALDVDLAIAGSSLEQAYLEECSIPKERISLVGYADYDEFAQKNATDCRRLVLERYPEVQGRRIILFGSQYSTSLFSDGARLANLAVVRQCADNRPDLFFLVKPHPRREVLPSGFDDAAGNLRILDDLAAADAICGADVFVTFWSTTALEAILLGTPLIQLNATGLPDFFDVSTTMNQRFSRSAQDLSLAIDVLLSPSGREGYGRCREHFIKRIGAKLDGHAAERAASEICRVFEQQKTGRGEPEQPNDLAP